MPRTYTCLPIGSISEGTLRVQDMIYSFRDALAACANLKKAETSLISDCDKWLEAWDAAVDAEEDLAWEAEAEGRGGDLVERLSELLEGRCHPYTYFGSTEGDGACFGVWPAIDQLEEAARDGEVLKVSDIGDIPPDHAGDVMVVNDHGNVTYGHVAADGLFKSIWSCV